MYMVLLAPLQSKEWQISCLSGEPGGGRRCLRWALPEASCAAEVHLLRCQLRGGKKNPPGMREVAVVLFSVGWV